MGYVKLSILQLILAVLLSAGLSAQDQTLFILHTNNTNGALENCYCPDHPFGSVEKRTIFVKDFINEHPNTVLVDAGDFFTMTHQSYKDSLMAEAYALLPYDAILPGDQELTMDGDKIDPLLGLMNTKIVGTNIAMDGVNNLVSSHLVDRGGYSIAIMGIMDPYAVKYYSDEIKEKIKLNNPIDAVKSEMGILKKKADIFVLLTHQGADLDVAFAEKVKGIDVIVGSHSQSAMDEPKEVNGTLIVQAGKEGYYVGTVEMVLKGKEVVSKTGRIDTMKFTMPDDDRVMNMIHEYENKTGRINRRKLKMKEEK
jgi:2',3'-cyclic-nucleotide 2'-phosphodiesterase (5'-nucleotidase family)